MKQVLFLAAGGAARPFAVKAQEVNALPGFCVAAGDGITTPLSSPNDTTGLGWVSAARSVMTFVGSRVYFNIGYGNRR